MRTGDIIIDVNKSKRLLKGDFEMKRFIKEYANYQLANNPFYTDNACEQLYVYRINKAVKMYEKGFITENNAIEMIFNAEQYAMQEAKA